MVALLRRRLRPRSPPVARLTVLCRLNCRLNHRPIRSCSVACSRDRHRCRCRSPLHRLRRPNSCVGSVLMGVPLRADSDSPGSAWTAPRADHGLGLGSAREDSTAAPGVPAEEARDGSAAAAGVSMAALRRGLLPRRLRMATLLPGQRSRSSRHPGWDTSCFHGRRNLPRCPECPYRAASCSPGELRRLPGCPTSSASLPRAECSPPPAGLAFRAPAAPISSLSVREVMCRPRADRPR